MTARIYNAADWFHAQPARARRGKAPRLAVQRGIYLRQAKDGRWDVLISERRFGKWGKPTYAGERRVRPFYEGVSEPQAVPA